MELIYIFLVIREIEPFSIYLLIMSYPLLRRRCKRQLAIYCWLFVFYIVIGVDSSYVLNMGFLFIKYIVNTLPYSVAYIFTLLVVYFDEYPFFILI